MERKWPFHWAWVILATCFFNLFINYSIRLGYVVILPEMIHNLGFSRTAGGSIYNSHFLSYIAIAPLIGYLTDRLGARRVITVCCLILGFGVFLMGTIEVLWTACLFYAIAGLGATGMWTPVITVVQRWFSPQRRGLAMGIISTGPGLGLATIGAIFPWIVQRYDWHYAWYILGAGALVMFIVNGLLIRSDPESSGHVPWGQVDELPPMERPTEKTQAKDGTIPLILKNVTFWYIGLSYFSIAYSLFGITTFMVDYAQYQIGLPLDKASLLATVHGIGQVIGVLTVLPFSDYLGRKKTLIISNSFITGCLMGILFSGNSWELLFILVGIMAIFFGATFPLYGVCAGDYFPKKVIGTVIGAWTPFYGLGAISVHWISGILRDTTGIYSHAFMINAAMAAIGIVLICLVKKRKGS